MSKVYQQRLSNLLAQLDLKLDDGVRLQIKPFFGGAAAYVDGRICFSLTKVGFALKLPLADRQMLFESGAQPLRYFPKAPIKKEYVLLPETIMENDIQLRAWVKKSINYVVKYAESNS